LIFTLLILPHTGKYSEPSDENLMGWK
jgi:hypothetical protein